MRLGESKRIAKKLVCRAAVVVLVASSSLWAQSPRMSGRTNTNSAQAVLHIRVNVVPIVVAPKQETIGDHPSDAVNYLIPTVTLQQETITQEMTVPTMELQNQCAGDSCRATLRTTTVVPR